MHKIPTLQGPVGPLQCGNSESMYVTSKAMTSNCFDDAVIDAGKAVRREVSKAISWAGTASYVELGRKAYANHEAIRARTAHAPAQESETQPVLVSAAKSVVQKRKVSNGACRPISGNAPKKQRTSTAAEDEKW